MGTSTLINWPIIIPAFARRDANYAVYTISSRERRITMKAQYQVQRRHIAPGPKNKSLSRLPFRVKQSRAPTARWTVMVLTECYGFSSHQPQRT